MHCNSRIASNAKSDNFTSILQMAFDLNCPVVRVVYTIMLLNKKGIKTRSYTGQNYDALFSFYTHQLAIVNVICDNMHV